MFDVLENVYAKAANNGKITGAVNAIEYWRDVWSILERPCLLSWVNPQANSGHGETR